MSGFSSPLSPDEVPVSNRAYDGCWPVTNGLLAYYAIAPGVMNYHTGHDAANVCGMTKGAPLYAVGYGAITFARRIPNSTWGNVIVLECENPDGGLIHFRYGHLDSMIVRVGDRVERGQMIGTVGDAFGRFAPHLHFDASLSGILKSTPHHWPGRDRAGVLAHYIDPVKWIREHAYVAQPTEYQRFIAALEQLPGGQPVIVAMDGQDYELKVSDFRPVKEYVITANLLNVRSQPSMNGAILYQVRQGTRVQVNESRDGWGNIGKGWISMQWARSA